MKKIKRLLIVLGLTSLFVYLVIYAYLYFVTLINVSETFKQDEKRNEMLIEELQDQVYNQQEEINDLKTENNTLKNELETQ